MKKETNVEILSYGKTGLESDEARTILESHLMDMPDSAENAQKKDFARKTFDVSCKVGELTASLEYPYEVGLSGLATALVNMAATFATVVEDKDIPAGSTRADLLMFAMNGVIELMGESVSELLKNNPVFGVSKPKKKNAPVVN